MANKILQFPANDEPRLTHIVAEQAILGALLLDNRLWSEAAFVLTPADFWVPLHGEIYWKIGKDIEAGDECTPMTLTPFFDGSLPADDYISRLCMNVPISDHIATTARMLRNMSKARTARRYFSAWGEEISDLGNLDTIAEEMIDQAEAIRDNGTRRRKAIRLDNAMKGVLATVRANIEAERAGTPIRTVKTGLRAFDHYIGGLFPGDLIILAGRPSMGKSALALTILDNVVKDGYSGLLHSLEMSVEQNIHRLLSSRTGILSTTLRSTTPRLSTAQMDQLAAAQREVDGLPMHIDDTGSLTIGELGLRAKAHKAKYGLHLLIVDYLQLMTGPEENMVQRITTISRGLKMLAKDLEVPVIALSQLSRAVEQRENKRPQLSDLRESGAIEQDADVVAFVYRQEAYERKKEPEGDPEAWAKWKADYEALADKAEVIIDKQRQGPTGIAHLIFDSETTQFRDREEALI